MNKYNIKVIKIVLYLKIILGLRLPIYLYKLFLKSKIDHLSNLKLENFFNKIYFICAKCSKEKVFFNLI